MIGKPQFRLGLVMASMLLSAACAPMHEDNLRSAGKLEAGNSACTDKLFRSNQRLAALQSAVARGNQDAARCLALHLNLLDGGNLEDSLISLGEFSNYQMGYFLYLRKDHLISQRSFENALAMLPLMFVEDLQASLTEINNRKAAVLKIGDQNLAVQKQQALNVLNRILNEMKNKNSEAKIFSPV